MVKMKTMILGRKRDGLPAKLRLGSTSGWLVNLPGELVVLLVAVMLV